MLLGGSWAVRPVILPVENVQRVWPSLARYFASGYATSGTRVFAKGLFGSRELFC